MCLFHAGSWPCAFPWEACGQLRGICINIINVLHARIVCTIWEIMKEDAFIFLWLTNGEKASWVMTIRPNLQYLEKEHEIELQAKEQYKQEAGHKRVSPFRLTVGLFPSFTLIFSLFPCQFILKFNQSTNIYWTLLHARYGHSFISCPNFLLPHTWLLVTAFLQ